jgi:hypothetical protein
MAFFNRKSNGYSNGNPQAKRIIQKEWLEKSLFWPYNYLEKTTRQAMMKWPCGLAGEYPIWALTHPSPL